MNSILKVLLKETEPDIREQCARRYDALWRQYRYLLEKQDEYLSFTFTRGWFSDRYKVLFALNSFFQIVMGPLASSSRGVSQVGVGSKIPISYGSSIKFDESRNKAINKVYSDFNEFIQSVGMEEWWLNLNQASDIVFQIAKRIKENEKNE